MEEHVKSLVVKSNSLVESKYKLTAREQKVVLYLISQIRKEDDDFRTYTLPIKKFSEMLGLKGKPKYEEMKKITKDLMGKVMEMKIGMKTHQVAWLSYVVYNEDEGTVDLRFDLFLKPFLLQLKKEFTSYRLQNVVSLKGSYSIRLYELLKQYETIKERTFDLTELKELLGVSELYPAYGNFKQRVLKPAKEEIADKTDIVFDFEEIKNGRTVHKIKFQIKPQIIKLKEKVGINKKQPLYSRINDLASKHGYSVNEQTVLRWEELAKKKWDFDCEKNLLLLVGEINRNNEVKNPIGYITSILKSKDDVTNFKPMKALTKEEKRKRLMLGLDDDKKKNVQEMSEEERLKRRQKMFDMLNS